MNDTYNSALGYLRKSRGSQTEDQCHRTVSNLVLKGKFLEAVQFVCDREKGVIFQPDKLAEDCTGMINKTVASVLEEETSKKNNSFLYCIRNVQGDAYFHPHRHHGGSCRISSAKIFGEF